MEKQLKCVVCATNFENNCVSSSTNEKLPDPSFYQIGDEHQATNVIEGDFSCQKMFRIFCDHLFTSVKSVPVFANELSSSPKEFPFCSRCTELISYLSDLDKQLETVKIDILTIVSTIVTTILTSFNVAKSRQPQDNGKIRSSDPVQNSSYAKIDEFRQAVVDQWSPFVRLQKGAECGMKSGNKKPSLYTKIASPSRKFTSDQSSIYPVNSELGQQSDHDDPVEIILHNNEEIILNVPNESEIEMEDSENWSPIEPLTAVESESKRTKCVYHQWTYDKVTLVNKATYECDSCNHVVPNETTMWRHILEAHQIEKDPEPEVITIPEFKTKLVTTPSGKEVIKFVCPFCSVKLLSEDRLLRHIKKGQCGQLFIKHRAKLQRKNEPHVVECGPGQFAVSLTSLVTKTLAYELNNHPDDGDNVSDETKFKCLLCPHLAPSHRLMMVHIRVNHKKPRIVSRGTLDGQTIIIRWMDGKLSFDGPTGTWPFEKLTPEEGGNRNRHGDTVRCGTCGHVLNGMKRLTNHVKKRHSAPEEFICDICGKTLRHRDNYLEHRRNYHSSSLRGIKVNVKRVLCHECGKTFSTRTACNTHLISLHGRGGIRAPKKFECSHPSCSKKFRQQAELNNHLHSHSKEKKFQCPDCPKRFKQQTGLDRHKKSSHMYPDKPYSCPVCSKRFTQIQSVQIHVKNVHKGVREPQQDCEK